MSVNQIRPEDIRPANQLRFEEVMVGNPPPMRVEYTDLDIELVDLDPNNPRLKYRQQIDGKKPIELLFQENDTKLLKEDIKRNGLFERPFVRRMPNGRYVVFEGNRRVGVFQINHEEMPDDPRWKTIPVRVLPNDISDEQQAKMLALFHIQGKLEWNAHERAGHIYQMSEILKMPDEDIKTTLHMGKPAILKSIAAYKMMMEVFVTVDGGKYQGNAERKFSFFEEFQKSKPLRERAGVDSFFAADFCRWVGEERLKTAVDVRSLPAILSDSIAERQFKEHLPADAFRNAMASLERSDASRKSNFFRKLKEAIEAGNKATLSDFSTANSASGRQLLQDMRAVLETVHRHSESAKL